MSCDSEQQQLTPNAHLEPLLQQIKPKARYLSEMHVEEFIDSIYLEIINGDTQIAKQQTSYNTEDDKKNGFEDLLKKRIVEQAEKQKKTLQQKLTYLDRSINMLFREDKHSKHHRHSISVSSPRQKQQWREQMKERAKNIEKKKQEIQENKKKKEQELKEIEERIKKQQEDNKKKQIEQHMKMIEERAKKRESLIKSANQRYKELKKNKSLFQKMNESFNERQSSVLEERKKKLSEIRNLHKPLDTSELQEHEQKFLQLKRQKQEMREREKRMNQSRSNSYQPFYRSVFYKKALEDSRNEVENSDVLKRDKMKQFSDHVKQCFVPEVDEKKREAIEEYIEKEQRKIEQKYIKEKQLLEKSKIKGNQYLEEIKKIPKKKNTQANSKSVDNVSATNRIHYENYLTHSKVNDSEAEARKWNKILTDHSSNKQEKALLLQLESQKRESALKRQEQQVRLLKNGDSQDIDSEYYNMIKAKLDLLQTDK